MLSITDTKEPKTVFKSWHINSLVKLAPLHNTLNFGLTWAKAQQMLAVKFSHSFHGPVVFTSLRGLCGKEKRTLREGKAVFSANSVF